ncbi:hydrophobin [Phlebopus sp. FC_14]|nr:hydrophobin [Phlebopus sp. FC_14]
MFAHLFAVASLAAIALATPLVVRDGECNTGPVNCCNNVQDVSDASAILSQINLADVLAGVVGQVGFDCSPITGLGMGSGATCQQQSVCCNGNRLNGLININCSPVNINA